MKKKSALIISIALLVIVGIFAGWYVNTSKELTEMRNLAKKYEADIQTELQTRFEKVPNLVEIVQGAAKHEEKIISEIAQARTKYNNALASGDTNQMIQADNDIKVVLTKIEENYPEIASMKMYQNLMDEYSGIEAAVNVARRNYNEVVMEYNNIVEGPLSSFVAQSKGFERIEEFKASPEANNPVKIEMD